MQRYPNIVSMEPPLAVKSIMEKSSDRQSWANRFHSGAPQADTFFSFYIYNKSMNQTIANTMNYATFYAPAVKTSTDFYAVWDPNQCEKCTFFYQTPGTPATCIPVGSNASINDLINWYSGYRGGSSQNSDLNCDTKINIDDLIFWYQKYRS